MQKILIFFYLFNICFAIGFCHDSHSLLRLKWCHSPFCTACKNTKLLRDTLKKHLADKRKSPPSHFPPKTATEQSQNNGCSAIIPFCLRDYAVSTENALLGKSRSRAKCHAPQKKAYASAILGTLNPNLFKIIDIARALCYYKQADNCILHFCASHVRRLEKYPRGRRGSPAKGVVRVNRSQGSNPCFSAKRE